MTEALRIDLLESTALTIADAGHISDVLRRMQRDPAAGLDAEVAREVALREGLKAVIAGEVRELGGQYLLTATIRSASDGEVLAAFREDAPGEAELLQAVDALGSRIREKVGESLRSVRRSEPLEAVTTASLPALRLYSQATKVRHRTGDPARAVELLERAVAEDTTFAVAWRALGIQLSNMGRDPVRMKEAFTRAYQHRDRLQDHERYMTEAGYYAYVVDDPAAAEEAYRTLLELHPDHTPALNNLSIGYAMTGRLEEAEQLIRRALAVEEDPLYYGNLGNALAGQGRYPEADTVFQAAHRRFPNNLQLMASHALLLGSMEAFDRLDSLLAVIETEHPNGRALGAMENVRAATDILHGRLGDGLDRLQRALALSVEDGFFNDGAGALRLMLDTHLLLRQDTAAAVATLERLLPRFPVDALPGAVSAHANVARLAAAVGQADRADSLLAVDRQRRAAEGLDQDLAIHSLARGYTALAQGRPEAAIAAFEEADRRPSLCFWCVPAYTGLAHQQAGRADAAIEAWTRAIETPAVDKHIFAAAWTPYLTLRLGELHDARGDAATAVRYYTELLELWRDADPELRPTVERVRDRVARLTAEPG